MKTDLSTNIGGIKLKNPVLTASGTFGYGNEIGDLLDLSKLGGIITKTITIDPRAGNPPPRLAETPSGILNSIGLQNIGLEKFLDEKSVIYEKYPVPVIVSIAGVSDNEYLTIVKALNGKKWVKGIELNLSCPNLKKKIISQDAKSVKDIVKKVKKVSSVPVIAKLSPQVTDLSIISQAAKDGGADALSLVNTFLGMAINIKTCRPKLANVIGGLSGPCVKPQALRCVWEVYNKVKIDIIGCGGIATGDDAVEFFLAGAKAVSVGTATFIDPENPVKVVNGINQYLRNNKKALKEIIGKLKT